MHTTIPGETRHAYRLFGPLTAVQALYLASAAGLAWRIDPAAGAGWAHGTVAGTVLACGLAAAFGRWPPGRQGEELPVWAVRLARYVGRPRRRPPDAAVLWCDVAAVRRGVVSLRSGAAVQILAVGAVPLHLRDGAEQEALLAAYGDFLNSLDGPVELLTESERMDLTPYLERLAAPRAAGPAVMAALGRAYARFVGSLVETQRILVRRHFLVLRCDPPRGGDGEPERRRLAVRAAAAASALARLDLGVRLLDDDEALRCLARAYGGPGHGLPGTPGDYLGLAVVRGVDATSLRPGPR